MQWPQNQLITGSKMATAGAITFLLFYYFQLNMEFWSVVTVAAITQSTDHDTFIKSIMRAGGTITGAVIGLLVATISQQNPYLLIVMIFILITATSFFSLQKTVFSYGGITAGMTIAIILFYDILHLNIMNIAISRTIEILLGVFVLAILNTLILAYTYKLKTTISYTVNKLNTSTLKISLRYLFPAMKVAIACLLTFVLWYFFKLPQGYWATITCLLIMEEGGELTLKKGFLRLIAHVIAVSLALAITLLLHNTTGYIFYIFPLVITFFLCGYLISSQSNYASMGNTIAIAVSILLLATPNAGHTNQFIYERFYNVMIGVFIAFTTLSINYNPFYKNAT